MKMSRPALMAALLSAAVSLRASPGQVQGLQALSSADKINLSWTANADITAGDKYEIEISSWSPSSFTFLTDIIHPGTTHQVSALVNGNTYYFRVRASTGTLPDEIGEWSAVASTAPWVALGVPAWTASAVAVSTGSINWSWAAAANAQEYRVLEFPSRNDLSGVLSAAATYWIQTGLTPNASSETLINARNGLLSKDSSAKKIFTHAAVPSNFLSPLQPGTTRVNLLWSASANPSSVRYMVERSTYGSGDWNLIAQLSDATTHQDAGLAEKTTYTYRIRAVNSDDIATASVEFSTTTGSANPQPPSLTLAQPWNYDGEVQLAFTAPKDDSDDEPVKSYVIKYATYTLSEGVWSSPSSSVAAQNITPAAPGVGQAHVITGLYPGTTYYFAMKSVDEAGNFSAISAVQSSFARDYPPNTPTNISALATSETNVQVTWTLPSYNGFDDRWRYWVYRATYSFTLASQATFYSFQVHPNAQYNDSPSDNAIKREATYYYRVASQDLGDGPDGSGLYSMALGSSSLSSEMALVRTPDLSPPPPITTLTALTGSLEGRINLSWTSPPDNTVRPYEGLGENISGGAFRLRWTTNPAEVFSTTTYNVEIPTTTFPGATNYYLITGLSGGSTYYLRIWTRDDTHNWSAASMGATAYAQVDITPPSAVTRITLSAAWRRLNLVWTSPGDDGVSGNLDGKFEMRLSSVAAIADETAWNGVSPGYPYRIVITTTGVAPGSDRYFTVTGLTNSVTYYAAIKSADDNSNWSVVSSTSPRGTPLNSLPAAFSLVSPANGGQIQTYTPQLSWNASSDADSVYGDAIVYDVSYSTSSLFETSVTTSVVKTDPTHDIPAGHLEEDKRYYWRVRARDLDGATRLASQDFSLVTNIDNSTPTAPALQSPAAAARTITATPQLSWLASEDSDILDVVTYTVQWSQNPNFSTYAASSGISATYYATVPLAENATYWWRVFATDGKVAVQSAATFYFKINATPEAPYPFDLSAPAENVRVTTTTVNFLWNQTVDPDPDESVKYNLIWSQFSTFSTSITVSNLTSATAQVKVPNDNLYYFWKVEAVGTDAMKRASNQSFQRFYTDLVKEPPLPFILIEPGYGVVISTTLKPMFKWQAAVDPDPADTVRYYIEISQSQDFAGVQPIPSATDNYYRPLANLIDQTTYYWRVRAGGFQGSPAELVDDDYTFATTTGVFIISMVNYPPEPFSLLSPPDGGTANTKQPVFSWERAVDNDVGATIKYSIAVSSSADFTTLVFSSSGLTATSVAAPRVFLENRYYYWRITAVDNKDGATDSAVFSFRIPVLTTPQKVCGIKTRLSPSATSFAVSWASVDYNSDGTPIDDLAGYNIYKSIDLAGFSSAPPYVFVDKSVLSANDPVSGNYYYMIRAVDTSGVESGDSAVFRVFEGAAAYVESPDKIFLMEIPAAAAKGLIAENNEYGENLMVGISTFPSTLAIREFGLDVLRPDGRKIDRYTFREAVRLRFSGDRIRAALAQTQRPTVEFTSSDIALFWNNGVEFIKMPTSVDSSTNEAASSIINSGVYQIRKSKRAAASSLTAINPPKVFTPGIAPYEKIQFFIENPFTHGVFGEIIGIKGQKVADMKSLGDNRDVSVVLEWDGLSSDSGVVPKGVYIYQITVGDDIINGTIISAR